MRQVEQTVEGIAVALGMVVFPEGAGLAPTELLPDGLWRRTMSVSEDGGLTWRVLFTDELRVVAR